MIIFYKIYFTINQCACNPYMLYDWSFKLNRLNCDIDCHILDEYFFLLTILSFMNTDANKSKLLY